MENENNKVVYNSISDLVNKEPEPEDKAKIASNTKSDELQIISNLEDIAPAVDHDDKMKMDDTNFWKEMNENLDKSLYDTDRRLREAVEKKELEAADKEDEKILNGEYSDDEEVEGTTPELEDVMEEDLSAKEEYVPKKKYNKQAPAEAEEEFDLFNYDEDAFLDDDELDEEKEENEEEEKEFLRSIQNSIKNKIKTVNKPVDISSFNFSKKRISANKAIKTEDETTGRVVTWMLYNTGKKIRMTEFKGYEIEQISTSANNRNGRTLFKMYQDVFKIIYNHVVDEDKIPFEAWLKSIKFTDMNDLYFAVYQACFTGANAIPYSCDKCGHVFMNDAPLETMVKYADKETEERVHEILNGEYIIDGTEDIDIVMISDKYAVGLKKPSLYNVYFEMSILDDAFSAKYESFLKFMSYIDDIYVIDRKNNELVPIDISIADARNMTKAIKNKIIQYSKILRTLTFDQFDTLRSYIFGIDQGLSKIEYRLPATECPKCHASIEAEKSRPEDMIFLRRQLLLLASSSIN